MISKNTIKFLKSLQIKKYRKKENAFIVEGAKNVLELLRSDYHIKNLWVTDRFYNQYAAQIKEVPMEFVGEQELNGIGQFKTNNAALALVEMPPYIKPPLNSKMNGLILDDIRDPGNMGTILRIADWYGLGFIIASETCADLYNPKVITASMGSFCRVSFYYEEIEAFVKETSMQVMGAFLDGESVHSFKFPRPSLILIGNESHGIRDGLAPLCKHRISIPRYGGAESLNAAIATAVICDNMNRNQSG